MYSLSALILLLVAYLRLMKILGVNFELEVRFLEIRDLPLGVEKLLLMQILKSMMKNLSLLRL